jgi:hypothetical protein
VAARHFFTMKRCSLQAIMGYTNRIYAWDNAPVEAGWLPVGEMHPLIRSGLGSMRGGGCVDAAGIEPAAGAESPCWS